jgi:hypothetical protein
VPDTGLRALGVDADAEGDERLEERAQKRAAAANVGLRRRALQERASIDVEEPCGEGRIREVMLRRGRESGDAVPRR